MTVAQLERYATYQKRFVAEAVTLLKPGTGILTYSTCTIVVAENEGMVRHILDQYPCMELVPVVDASEERSMKNFGCPGLANCGLTDNQRRCVRRFGYPSSSSPVQDDTIGFFVAKFRKTRSCNNDTDNKDNV